MTARSPAPERLTVSGAAVQVLMHPWQVFVVDWNWKTALLSALCRMAVWPAAMLGHGILSAGSVRAFWIEFAFRITIGGFWGSLLQVFSGASPAWLAGLCMAALLPGCTHYLEYLVLQAGGVPRAGSITAVSIAFSILSLLVNWGLMRKGMLLTSRGAASLGCDLRRVLCLGGRSAGT